MPFTYEHPQQEQIGPFIAQWQNLSWIIGCLNGPINWDSGTPNIYTGWLETNRVSCLRRITFYNPHDYALQMPVWGFNQLLKPDRGGITKYMYVGTKYAGGIPNVSGGLSATTPFVTPSAARTGTPIIAGICQKPGYFFAQDSNIRYLNFEFSQNDMYETMAFAAEARSFPLGMIVDQHVFDAQINLTTIWTIDADPDPQNGVYGRHKWHSAEFRSNNAMQTGYWQALLGIRGFGISDK